MTDISHTEAVGVLKATEDKVTLKVEKNAISQVTPTSSSDVLVSCEHTYAQSVVEVFIASG